MTLPFPPTMHHLEDVHLEWADEPVAVTTCKKEYIFTATQLVRQFAVESTDDWELVNCPDCHEERDEGRRWAAIYSKYPRA